MQKKGVYGSQGRAPSRPPCEGLCRGCRAEGCVRREPAERCFRIRGGRPLSGKIKVHGAKNSVLPVLAASVLCGGPVHLARVPRLSDTGVSLRILESLGCVTALSEDEAAVRTVSVASPARR